MGFMCVYVSAYVSVYVMWYVCVCVVNLLSTEASRLRYFDLAPEMSSLVPTPLFPWGVET